MRERALSENLSIFQENFNLLLKFVRPKIENKSEGHYWKVASGDFSTAFVGLTNLALINLHEYLLLLSKLSPVFAAFVNLQQFLLLFPKLFSGSPLHTIVGPQTLQTQWSQNNRINSPPPQSLTKSHPPLWIECRQQLILTFIRLNGCFFFF